MKAQRVEEGAFVETVDGLIFEVRGSVHPADRIIAFIAYVPDQKGDRLRGSSRFRRIHDLSERYEYLRNERPEYLYFDPSRQRVMQAVPHERVEKIYYPREKFRVLIKREPERGIEAKAAEFAEAIAKNSGVPLADIGVSGSILVDLYTQESDIDLVIYGEENGRKVYEALREMRKEGEWISPHDEISVRKVCIFRWGRSGLHIEQMIPIERAKVLQGRVDGMDYFIKLVKDISENVDLRYIHLGEAVIKAKVVDDRDSIFAPCRYGLVECEFLGGKIDGGVREICSFMAKFAEMARVGDRVEARGKVEEVTNGKRYFRLLLESDKDYLVRV